MTGRENPLYWHWCASCRQAGHSSRACPRGIVLPQDLMRQPIEAKPDRSGVSAGAKLVRVYPSFAPDHPARFHPLGRSRA